MSRSDTPIPTKVAKKQYYSTFRRAKDLNTAMLDLYLEQAPNLLQKIQTSNPDPEIRVGLSIKILYNTPPDTRFPLLTIQPIINDIETMIKDRQHLKDTGEPHLRLRCLRQELKMIQNYIDLDDTISLNCAETELTYQTSVVPMSEIADPVAEVTEAGSSDESIPESDGKDGDNCVVQ